MSARESTTGDRFSLIFDELRMIGSISQEAMMCLFFSTDFQSLRLLSIVARDKIFLCVHSQVRPVNVLAPPPVFQRVISYEPSVFSSSSTAIPTSTPTSASVAVAREARVAWTSSSSSPRWGRAVSTPVSLASPRRRARSRPR